MEKTESEELDSFMTEDRSFEIETPVGSIKSDSGNHLFDVVSVVGVVIILYAGKKMIESYWR